MSGEEGASSTMSGGVLGISGGLSTNSGEEETVVAPAPPPETTSKSLVLSLSSSPPFKLRSFVPLTMSGGPLPAAAVAAGGGVDASLLDGGGSSVAPSSLAETSVSLGLFSSLSTGLTACSASGLVFSPWSSAAASSSGNGRSASIQGVGGSDGVGAVLMPSVGASPGLWRARACCCW